MPKRFTQNENNTRVTSNYDTLKQESRGYICQGGCSCARTQRTGYDVNQELRVVSYPLVKNVSGWPTI